MNIQPEENHREGKPQGDPESETASPGASSLPKLLFSLFAWVCVLASFYFIATNWPGNDQFAIMFEEGKWRAYFWLAGMLGCAQVLRGARWALLLSSQKVFHWRSVIPIHGWYFLVLAFSPMRSGDLGRVLWAKSQGVSGFWATGTVIVERIFDMLVLFSLLSLMLIVSPLASATLVNAAFLWMVVVIVIYLLLTLYAEKGANFVELRFGETATSWPTFLSTLFFRVIRLFHGMSVIKTVKINISSMLLTVGIWLLVVGGYYFFLNALMPEVTFASVVAVIVFVALSSFIGVAPGNIGIYEMATLLALKSFGIEPDNALASAIWVHLASISVLLVYGLICRVILYRMGTRTI